MNLVIDQGNSSAKVEIFEEEKVVFYQKYERFSVEEAESLLREYDCRQAILSTVVDEDELLTRYLSDKLEKWVCLTNETTIPIEILYETPKTLGRDRIAVCVGANYLMPDTNLLVIDVGTAITFDIVNSQNQYVGGNISLGIDMRRKALHTFTAKLPLIEVDDDAKMIGTTTETAIESGIIHGIEGEINSFIAAVSEVYPNLNVFLTGGSAKCFEKRIKSKIFAERNLVHIGLNRILNYR
jgi:type III pantothenate kinase